MRERLNTFDKVIVLVAVLGALGVLTSLAFRPTASKVERVRAKKEFVFCTHSTTLKPEWFCGSSVLWINPNGSRSIIGKTSQMKDTPSHPEVPRN